MVRKKISVRALNAGKKRPKEDQYQRAERRARRRLEANPKDLDALARLARALLRQHRLDEAYGVYSRVAREDPDHRDAHAALAALKCKFGQVDEGRALLEAYFERCPFRSAIPEGVEGRPALLKIRGFDKTKITLGARNNGSTKWKMRGGHFSTRFLLPDPDFAVHTYTITKHNIRDATTVPPHDLILNTIAEADVEGASLATLQSYLDQNPDVPLINRPEQILKTTRDGNFQRLQGFEGLRFPRTMRLAMTGQDAATLARELEELGFDYPLLLREVGTQTGRTFGLIEGKKDLERYVRRGLHGTWYAIKYHEILFQGRYFRKLRLFCIDGVFYPVVCHIDQIWNVHGGNRKEMMRGSEELMGEEKRFLADWRSYVGARAADGFERLMGEVGLDFFGADFTLDPDGNAFIYELNAAMRHSFDHAQNFPYKLPYDQAITDAFSTMVSSRLQKAFAVRTAHLRSHQPVE